LTCLNRFLTEVRWDAPELNRRRLELLQRDPDTRYSADGIIPIDNVLIDHHGELIADVGWFWDHVEQRYLIAHDYLFIDYVCSSGKHYPLDFRRFQKEDTCAALGIPFHNHTALCRDLIDWACAEDIPGTFALDSSFTGADILNHIHGKHLRDGQPRGYVGALKFNRKLEYRGRQVKAAELAQSLAPAQRKRMSYRGQQQWYFSCSLRIPLVNHKVRILIIWQQRDDEQPRLILVTNRIRWEANRIVRAYRHRWTGTETFHRDGKQQLGMGDCQLRDGQGQTRHMYLVMLAYSLLMRQLGRSHAYDWAYHKLVTIGEACRAMLYETFRTTLAWAITHVEEYGWSLDQVFAYLNLIPESQPQQT
jgi:hypothetical protein